MKATATSVQKIEETVIPDGVYSAFWGGYTVLLEIGCNAYIIKVDTGIRTVNCPCTVTVLDGVVTVESN